MENDSRNYKIGQKRIENQQKIIEAAEIEFAENGYKGASMMNVAKRAGIPRPNVHYYYKNKLDLYNAIIMDTLNLWNDAFREISEDDDPAEALGGYIRAKVMYSKSHPLASKIFASEVIHGAPHIKKYLGRDFRNWLLSKAGVIQHWIDTGKMDEVDPLHLIFLIWSSTQHYADFSEQVTTVMDKEKLSDNDFEQIAENLTHIILKGCGLNPNK